MPPRKCHGMLIIKHGQPPREPCGTALTVKEAKGMQNGDEWNTR